MRRKSYNERPIITAAVLIYVHLIALGFITLGIIGYIADSQFLSHAIFTHGTVISCRMQGGMCYDTVVQFQTQSGQFITYQGSKSSYSVGETVPVAYQADDPQNGMINPTSPNFALLFIGMGVAALCVVLGIDIKLLRKRGKQETKERGQRSRKQIQKPGEELRPRKQGGANASVNRRRELQRKVSK